MVSRKKPDPAVEAELVALLDRSDTAAAATRALQAYGPEILGWLRVTMRDPVSADEVFSTFAIDLWKGLAKFRRDCAVRVWAYKLAWNAAQRSYRDPHKRRARPLDSSRAAKLAADLASSTPAHLKSASKRRLEKLRAALKPEEQTLLTLRVDRDLAWSEVAEIMEVDEPVLRKRFERLKGKLRRRLEESA